MITRTAPVAYAAAVASIFGWASLYSVAKPALVEVSPLVIAAARASIASVILACLSLALGRGLRPGLAHLRAEATTRWHRVALVGLISFTGTSIIAMTAQQYLPASINGLLNNLSPLWIALFAAALGRTRHAGALIFGALLAAGGVATVLLGRAEPGGPTLVTLRVTDLALGSAISLSGSLLIAVAHVLTRRLARGRDPLALTAIMAGWGAVPLLVLLGAGVAGGFGAMARASAETWLRLLWLGTVSTAFNFALWTYALAHLPVTRVAPFQYLIAPASVAVAVFLLGEPVGPSLLAGTAAILAGIVLAQRGAERV